jgi:hypothetical protein
LKFELTISWVSQGRNLIFLFSIISSCPDLDQAFSRLCPHFVRIGTRPFGQFSMISIRIGIGALLLLPWVLWQLEMYSELGCSKKPQELEGMMIFPFKHSYVDSSTVDDSLLIE